MLLFCQITASIILITRPALHLHSLCVFSGFHSFLSNLSLISWIGLWNKSRGRRLHSCYQVSGSGARREKKQVQHLLGKYIPSPRRRTLKAGAKKSSRTFNQHKTGNYAKQKQSIWWTFLTLLLAAVWDAKLKPFLFCIPAETHSAHHHHHLAGCL